MVAGVGLEPTRQFKRHIMSALRYQLLTPCNPKFGKYVTLLFTFNEKQLSFTPGSCALLAPAQSVRVRLNRN